MRSTNSTRKEKLGSQPSVDCAPKPKRTFAQRTTASTHAAIPRDTQDDAWEAVTCIVIVAVRRVVS